MRHRRLARAAFLALIALLYVFLIAPIVIVVVASLNAGRFLVFPPEGLSLQWYVKFMNSGPFVRSFFFSLRLAALTTVITTVIGTAAALYNFDRSLEEAARSLGAGSVTAFRRITLPIIKGGVIAGAVFSFITSFDQFPISLLLSGVGTTTLPIQVFDYLRFSFDPTAAAVGTVNILITLGVVIMTERLVGLESLYVGGRQ